MKVTLSLLAFGVLPLILFVAFTVLAVGHNFAFDFRTFWHASRLVMHGQSPYPLPATITHSHPTSGDYEYFVYPPPFVLAILPLATLPFAAAAAIWIALLCAAVAGSLAIMGVRDWRCYGLVFASVPVLSSLRLGAVTPLLMLLVACAWRYRNEPLKAGAAVAGAILVKLFLWPLLLWLLVLRRSRAAATAAGGVVAVGVFSWAALRFHGLYQYPSLLRALEHVEGRESYSLVAVADRLHLSGISSSWLVLALPLVLVLLILPFARRQSHHDEAAFATAIGVAVLVTPIVWLNYFALLAVLPGVRRQTLAPEWMLLLLFWLTPSPEPVAHPLWQVVLALMLVLVVVTSPWRLHETPARGQPADPSAPRLRGRTRAA